MDELDAIKEIQDILAQNPDDTYCIVSTQVLRALLERATRDHD